VLLDVHQSFAWFVIVANGLSGLWCCGAHRWPQLRTRAMWWFVVFAEVTVFIQVILGVMLVTGVGGTKYEPPKFHMLYGFFGIFTIGILFSYKGSMRKWQYLLYGLGGLFIMGLGIRAVLVGTEPIGGA
jgi:hypothetical protein